MTVKLEMDLIFPTLSSCETKRVVIGGGVSVSVSVVVVCGVMMMDEAMLLSQYRYYSTYRMHRTVGVVYCTNENNTMRPR
jgi:hypothetical protein